jgi:citrate synthase
MTRLYHNLSGQLTAYVSQSEEYRGQLEQRLRTAEEAVRTFQAQATQAEQRAAQLQTQVEGLPALQEQANQTNTLQEQVDKLHLLMNYPAVTTRFVEREEPVEGQEEPRTVRVNPTLDLLMTSTLQGEDFATHVRDFVATLPVVQAQAAPEAGASLTPQPAPQQDRMARYFELYNAGQYDEALNFLQESMEQ